jgi:antitoxin (DNA-binding transcriptional repressor) of toxin-antitoxin stability system
MITVNMHEAKSRLSALVKAVEERGETVLLCRNGKVAAQIVGMGKQPVLRRNRIKPDPRLKVVFSPGYNPTEPLTDAEWPNDLK